MDSWLVWSNEHRLWWCADRRGYTRFIENAGRYTLEEATQICATRPETFTDDQPNPIPCMCIHPSPELIERLGAAADEPFRVSSVCQDCDLPITYGLVRETGGWCGSHGPLGGPSAVAEGAPA